MNSGKILAVAAVAALAGWTTAEAQQNFPRPIVLYRSGNAPQATRYPVSYANNPPQTTAGVPNAPRPATIVMTPAAVAPGSRLQPQNGAIQQVSQANGSIQAGQQQDQADDKPKTPEQEWMEQQSRPSNQMLQNPSGAANMTHSGFTSQQQMAPNTYFGQQYNSWVNQQPVSQMSSSFGEMSRMQPGQFGGYTAPNTYLGSGFSSWSNLSQGNITPGATGSWGYSVWP